MAFDSGRPDPALSSSFSNQGHSSLQSDNDISIAIDSPQTLTRTPAHALTRQHPQQYREQHQQPQQALQPICTTLPPSTRTSTSIIGAHTLHASDSSYPDTAGTLTTHNSLSDSPILIAGKFPEFCSGCKETTAAFEQSSLTIKPEELQTMPQPDPCEERLQRHPQRIRGSLYTRFFRLERPETRSNVIVQSSWLSTAALFWVRFVLFLYTATVLITDICMTERPRYEFCYLTQLSYLGLTAYLGTVSWHTLSEWRRERALHRAQRSMDVAQAESGTQTWLKAEDIMQRKTTIERQHWLLTDMIFFLYHTICTFHVIVPLLYWGYLGYEGDAHSMAVDIPPDALWRNYSFHSGDLAVVLIEIIINTMPFIPSHVVIVFAVCLLYLAEAHLVYRVDGFWIYPFLDTTSGPIWMAMYVGVGFAILCAFFLMYFLHRGRNSIRAKRARRRHAASQKHQQQMSEACVGAGEAQSASAIDSLATSAEDMESYEVKEVKEPGSYSYYINEGPMAVDHGISDIQTQNRKRSCSNCSDESTTSTLVGADEGIRAKKATRKQSADAVPLSPGTEQQLEKVEEMNEDEGEHDECP